MKGKVPLEHIIVEVSLFLLFLLRPRPDKGSMEWVVINTCDDVVTNMLPVAQTGCIHSSFCIHNPCQTFWNTTVYTFNS